MYLFISILAFILQQPSHTNIDKKGLAIQGYDPVAYFMDGATIGSEQIQFTVDGSTYYFSSLENKNLFQKNPEKYIPQYGGWCAYALGLGPDKVKINPETFKIIDDKLYLFYDFKGTNTLTLWNEDEEALYIKAEENWLKITE